MSNWIDRYAGIRGGGFEDGWWFGQLIATTYVNYLRKKPDPTAAMPNWLPKKPMGLEEFFEFECRECKIHAKANCLGFVHYEKGAWCGFMGTVMLFRRFKVYNMDDLMHAVDKHTAEQLKEMRKWHEEMERQKKDVDSADWWKNGGKQGGSHECD